jgi:hypothetical protein
MIRDAPLRVSRGDRVSQTRVTVMSELRGLAARPNSQSTGGDDGVWAYDTPAMLIICFETRAATRQCPYDNS